MPPVWHFFIICFFSSPGVGVYMMICVWHQSHPALWGTLQKQHFPQSQSVLKSILNQAVQDQPVQSWPRAEDKRASGWNGSWPGFLEKWWGAIPSHPCLCFAMPFRSWSWPWQLQPLPCHALFQWQLLTLSVTRLVPLLTVCSTSPKSEQPLCSKKPSPKQNPGCQGRDRESWVGTTTAVRCYISLNCKKNTAPTSAPAQLLAWWDTNPHSVGTLPLLILPFLCPVSCKSGADGHPCPFFLLSPF